MPSDQSTSSTNFNSFVKGPKHMFKLLGIKLQKQGNLISTVYTAFVVISATIVAILQLWQILTSDTSDPHRVQNVVFITYFTVGLGKILNILYRRSILIECLSELEEIYPDKEMERKYNLEHYLKRYRRAEYFFWNFAMFLISVYNLETIVRSFLQLYLTGRYGYLLLVRIYTPFPYDGKLLVYLCYFTLGSITGAWIAVIIAATDLYLLGCVLQLCLHFELLTKQLMELDTRILTESEAIKKLNAIAKYQSELIRLSRKVNRTFSGSMIVSLSAASFIICFLLFQLLGDVQLVDIAMVLILLLNESKQVLLICYCGDKLLISSQRFNESLYMHNWVDGSVRYQRHLLFMLLYAHNPIMLNLLDITDITLVTLKEVYGAAYRFFTVLKTA
ncbi:putative odorant receptor 92a [Glossina fuscipes]|uniref:Odorant receptor n=1 Tax=Glossina fuscipes TaxID=7396 RepID=A0A9C5ZF32_9MUSC|nr:putative odorant receptor 92a [Glossina fuscipes]